MLLPRSVAGTKRRAPPRGGSAPPVVLGARTAEGGEALACALLNWLSPWTCARRDDALAALVRDAQGTPDGVHVARLLATPEVAALGCTSSAELAAAIAQLASLGWARLNGFHVHFAPGDAADVVFVVRRGS